MKQTFLHQVNNFSCEQSIIRQTFTPHITDKKLILMNRDICVLERKHLVRGALVGELKSQESVSMFLFWRWDAFDRLIFGHRNYLCLGYFHILLIAYLVVIFVAGIFYCIESGDGERHVMHGQGRQQPGSSVSIRGGRRHWGRRPPRL